eukprot:scaffold18659_cov106-Isochrysis_galbana.AAC.1
MPLSSTARTAAPPSSPVKELSASEREVRSRCEVSARARAYAPAALTELFPRSSLWSEALAARPSARIATPASPNKLSRRQRSRSSVPGERRREDSAEAAPAPRLLQERSRRETELPAVPFTLRAPYSSESLSAETPGSESPLQRKARQCRADCAGPGVPERGVVTKLEVEKHSAARVQLARVSCRHALRQHGLKLVCQVTCAAVGKVGSSQPSRSQVDLAVSRESLAGTDASSQPRQQVGVQAYIDRGPARVEKDGHHYCTTAVFFHVNERAYFR